MSLTDFDPLARTEARMRYLAGGGDHRFLDPAEKDDPAELRAMMDYIQESRKAAIEDFLGLEMEPLIAKPPRVMPELDLPKPEYLHTIKLATPKVVKTTAVGTTYKAAKP